MKKVMVLMALALFVVSFTSCSAVQAISGGVQAYSGAHAMSHGYYANEMAKSLRNAEPLFQSYDSVQVETLIMPRDAGKAQQIETAFKDNIEYIVDENLKRLSPGKVICSGSTCSGKTIVVQFKEKDYNQNTFQKLTMGESIRGNLYYIDKQSGTVIKEESLEGLKTYEDILNMVNISVISKLIKEMKDAKKIQEAANYKFDPIKTEYKDLFKSS